MTNGKVLLLGGTGFIGTALAARFQQEGIPTYVLGRNDVHRLESLLPNCHTVIHLASGTTPGSSAARPGLELDNLRLTLRLLDLLKTQPETHLIFFSSGGTIYGNPDQLPVTEDAPIAPLSNHGAGKASQEVFCRALRAQGHAVTIVRPSNAYGPGQTLKNGFGLVRTILEHARQGTTVQIWGDGDNIRDFVYIEDVVEAGVRLAGLPHDSETYNLGSGVGFSINQVCRLVERLTGNLLQVDYRQERRVDVRGVVLDVSRLDQRLAWRPRVGLTEGVERTWKWLRST